MTKNVDIVSEIIGDWGPWQLRSVILIYLCKIPSAWFMAIIIFTAPIPEPTEVTCNQPETPHAFHHQTRPVPRHIADESTALIDFCFQLNRTSLTHPQSYVEDKSNGDSVPCTSFQFDTPFETTVTKFDLVCTRSILIAIAQFFHLFGVLTGGILAIQLMKITSPRILMLYGMILQIVFGCFAGLLSNYEVHMLLRYLAAVSCAQMYTAGQVIFTDITGSKYRINSMCFYEIFWSIGVILLPGIAYIDPNWSSISLMITLPTILYIAVWWFIPDTPRWFLAKGQVDEAMDIIKYAVSVNNTKHVISEAEIRKRLIDHVASSEKQPAPAKWSSLWNDRRTVVSILAIHISWAIYVTNYNGMLLNVKAFGREYLSLNTIALGFSEIVGVFIGYSLISNCKKKWQYAGMFNIFAGCFGSIGYFYPNSLSPDTKVGLLMLTAIIPKIAVSCSQAILFTCTAELVTPEKRKILIFSCVVWARICLLTAPFIIGSLIDIHQLLPLSVFGGMSMMGGMCTYLVKTSRTFEKPKNSEIELPTACVPGTIFMVDKF